MKLLLALLCSLLIALAACTPNQGDDATTDPVTQPSAATRTDGDDDGEDDDDGGDDPTGDGVTGSPDATGSPSDTPSASPTESPSN
jgi:hypothetical protein